eukprot:c15984_g2_i1 orf=76-309(+)
MAFSLLRSWWEQEGAAQCWCSRELCWNDTSGFHLNWTSPLRIVHVIDSVNYRFEVSMLSFSGKSLYKVSLPCVLQKA